MATSRTRLVFITRAVAVSQCTSLVFRVLSQLGRPRALARMSAGESVQIQFRAYYPCTAGAEAAKVPWLPVGGIRASWVILKSREIGVPAQRLCEAGLMSSNDTKELWQPTQASTIWHALPGRPRWTQFQSLEPGGNLSAKRFASVARPGSAARNRSCLSPELVRPIGGCKPLLFTAQAHRVQASAVTVNARSVRVTERAALLARAHKDEQGWWQSAANHTQTSSARYRCAFEHVRVPTPQIFTTQGLRAALASGVCSRACASARMKHRILVSGFEPKTKPCLVEDNHPQCQADARSVVLTISHWTGNLQWLQDQPFCFIVSEKYESRTAKFLDYGVPNKGNEASSYLNFMLTHYDELPDTMIFLQDQQTSMHNQNMVLILRQLHLDAAPYLPLNSVYMPFMDPRDFCNVRKCIASSGIQKYLNRTSLPLHHMDIAFTCCAQFLVSKAAVRARPKAMYRDLYRYTTGASDFGQRSDSFARGECLEVLWHVIFGERRVEQPLKPVHKCGKSDLAAVCESRSGLHAFVPANDTFWSWAVRTWSAMKKRKRVALRRLPEGALFEEAATQGTLCLLGNDSASVKTSAAGCVVPGVAGVDIHGRLQQSGGMPALVPELGNQPTVVGTNCSLLESGDLPTGSKRKLTKTLRQHCTGPQPAADRTSLMLFRQALCSLFEPEVEYLFGHSKRGRKIEGLSLKAHPHGTRGSKQRGGGGGRSGGSRGRTA